MPDTKVTLKDEDTENQKELSMQKLMVELDKGRCSGEKQGWLSVESVMNQLKARYNV